MKRLLLMLAATICLFSCNQSDCFYKIKNGKAVYINPERPSDQQSMLGFACDPIPNVRIGFVGMGMRGMEAFRRYACIDGATVSAICDIRQESLDAAQKALEKRNIPRADEYCGDDGFERLCAREDIDLIYLAVPWQLHTLMAVYAMEHGKHVAIEVPAATSVKECWDLVNTSERTRKHCIMLENCCYDYFELSCLNMAQKGVFGEIVHGEGAYCHNLDPFWDRYRDDWRMKYNREHRGDVYPTHGIGPVCQAMNIHRGDKMDVLISMDTDAFRGQELSDKRYGKGTYDYQNGDNTCTVIRTRKGKTILVEHSTITPRPYSRMYQLQGTEGLANKYPNKGLAVGGAVLKEVGVEDLDAEKYLSDKLRDSLLVLYQHPITRVGGLEEVAKKVGGHGGMDFIMDFRLIYCLNHGLPLDMDVYDAAEWSCLVELTETSIRHGFIPVEMPDFTRGEWDRIQGLQLAIDNQ